MYNEGISTLYDCAALLKLGIPPLASTNQRSRHHLAYQSFLPHLMALSLRHDQAAMPHLSIH